MKKLVMSCVSLLCLLSTQAKAELAPSLGFSSFALKSPDYEVQSSGGLSAGVSYFYNLGNETLDLEAGLYYVQAGGLQEGYTDSQVFVSNKLTLSYLVVPVGVRWKFTTLSNSSDSHLYTKAGIAPAFLMSAKQKVSAEGISLERDIKDDTNKTDFLGYVGIGGTFALAKDQTMMAELNYMHGTKQVLKDQKTLNEGFVVSLMYAMAL